MVNKYKKTCSVSLTTRGMQIKAILRFYLIQERMVIIIKSKITNVREVLEKKQKPFFKVGGSIN